MAHQKTVLHSSEFRPQEGIVIEYNIIITESKLLENLIGNLQASSTSFDSCGGWSICA